MTPADGADFPLAGTGAANFEDTQAIVLHGGRALLLFEGLDSPPPRQGRLINGDHDQPWTAECWRIAAGEAEQWCGLAVLEALPVQGARVRDAAGGPEWRLSKPPRIDIAPQPLADLVRRGGVDSRAVFGFLVKHLLTGRRGDSAEIRAHRAFATGFFTAAAERDGFIEILATPDGGGVFAQGWSMSLAAGQTTLASIATDLAVRDVEVAVFDRDDILPPGQGFCFFGKDWRNDSLDAVDAVFFENEGRLLRLDVAHGSVLQLTAAAATTHLINMLPRLRAPDSTKRAFKRVCRPCYHGVDTLAGNPAPIAAALDSVLRAPDGTLLVIGWMLDPLRRVERVLIKSTQNLYAPINATWCALPRPDLNHGFGADPRFAGLMDDHDILNGFIAHAPARRQQTDGAQVYLEIVLDDDTCLFRPMALTPFDSAERLPQILGALSPADPQLDRIVGEHLAPFLSSVRPTARGPRRGGAIRPIALGSQSGDREVAAIVPFRTYSELQPILSLLAGTTDAARLDLTLVASRSAAMDALTKLHDAFSFYGLQGRLVFASEHETTAGRLDTGVAATSAARILCWMPAALPKSAGWLDRLCVEAAALPVEGLLSPALTYEDGSIYYGGDRGDLLAAGGACARSGYGATWLSRGAPRQVSAGAPEIALIDRSTLDRVGGFSGHLFSDALTHVDLASRLRRDGFATYCSGAVEFWMLDDPQAAQTSPFAQLMQRVDAALLDRRATTGEAAE